MQSVRFLQTFIVSAVFGLMACAPPSHQPPLAPQTGDVSLTKPERPSQGVPTTGTVTLTIRWPERKDYAAQAIPLRTNSLVITITNASSSVVAEQTIIRPNGGSLVTTTDLDVAAGSNQRLDVKAYTEQTPGFDSIPIAQGTALDVAIAPSTQNSVKVVLVPTMGPVITGIPPNAGPLAYVTIVGHNFEGWGGAVKVYFGGVQSPYVSGSSTQLIAQVPSNAPNGAISVQADGVTGTSTDSCKIIRALGLSPVHATTSVNVPVDFVATARDASESLVPDPAVNWTSMSSGTAPLPGSSPPPPSTLVNGRFTPGSTGSYEIRIGAGTVLATASVTVN